MLSEPFAIRALAGTTRVRRRTPCRLLSRGRRIRHARRRLFLCTTEFGRTETLVHCEADLFGLTPFIAAQCSRKTRWRTLCSTLRRRSSTHDQSTFTTGGRRLRDRRRTTLESRVARAPHGARPAIAIQAA